MVLMLVFIEDFETKIYSLIAMQVLRVNYAYWIKSFHTEKDQIIEMFNEVTYSVLIVLLTQYTSPGKWTDRAAYVYTGIILSYLLIFIAIAMYTLIRFIWGAVKKLFKKHRIVPVNDDRNHESKVPGGSKGRNMRVFSDISFDIQHKQESIRVEKVYSFDSLYWFDSFESVDNFNIRRHATYQI